MTSKNVYVRLEDNPIWIEAETLAKKLRWSLSTLVAVALEEYLRNKK